MTSSPAEPPANLRDRQRAAVRADIHAAAYRLFAAKGFANVTTDDIAAEAAISPRTFFRHVATKEELLLAAVQRGGAAIASLLERRPDAEPPDVALSAAIVGRVESFDDVDLESWRSAILTAPELLDRVSLLGARRPQPTGRTRRRAHGSRPGRGQQAGAAGAVVPRRS